MITRQVAREELRPTNAAPPDAVRARRAVTHARCHNFGGGTVHSPIPVHFDKTLGSEEDMGQTRGATFKEALKRADLTYEELAYRLKKHAFKETKASIANKLARVTLPARFFLATLAAMGRGHVVLGEI